MELPVAESSELEFKVWSQKVDFHIDFLARTLKGHTEITVLPLNKDLKRIRLHCRQCRIKHLTVEGKAATYLYDDPYERLQPRSSASVYQHHLVQQKIEPQLSHPPDEELTISIPRSIHIKELDPFSHVALTGSKITNGHGDIDSSTGAAGINTATEQAGNFQPLKINIDFEVVSWREGLQFVGLQDGDRRYPYLYTRNSPYPGSASCLFPCVDRLSSQCSWEISITCPRTLGDAGATMTSHTTEVVKSSRNSESIPATADGIIEMDRNPTCAVNSDSFGLSDEEKLLELSVICSGEMTDEIIQSSDHSRKTVSFSCVTPVAPHHIGFAVGPFELVDLSMFREIDEDDKLGQNASRIHGFCLPGRADDLRNTCLPLAKAIDSFTIAYGAYPFESYKLCFVDDLPVDIIQTAGFSICSNRLLFPEGILDPLDIVTRKLVHGLASQWLGVNIVPEHESDTWAITGLAYYITDVFLKKLTGNNEYRYQQKKAADTVFELDRNRPSLHSLGPILNLNPSEHEFLALKSSVVLFILDRRLTKANGSSSVSRVVSRIFSNAKTGDLMEKRLSTSYLQRICEKIGHTKLDTFFQQWVYGAGCPHFQVRQQFNKKKLVVEMTIEQTQKKYEPSEHDIAANTFLREVKEDMTEVYAGSFQPVFTGPMTIRIHEADGTPYEHIVEIKEAKTRFDIPYNTKYKRLKRSRRQKERAVAASGAEASAEAQDDVLFYCLGDVLQSEEEVAEWRLSDWPKEEEDRMSQESYEWIRMDADFEWICKMTIQMPAYMFVSQLQQDRDVVAQLESVQYLMTQRPNPLNSTILTRTLVDRRYFHGIRTLAAEGLARCAKAEFDWIGLFHLEKVFQELYCFQDSAMTRSNDFSDRTAYMIQCAIPTALSKIKTLAGQAPAGVKRFFIDKLKFNDNSNNEFSDVYYVSTLLTGLAESLNSSSEGLRVNGANEEDDDEPDEEEERLKKMAVSEVERYRRIDGWTSSYQNVYSATALDCLLKLAKSKVYEAKLVEFLQYTRLGMADTLRLKAISCLVDLGMLRNSAFLRFCLFTLSTDSSQYMREKVFETVARGLGEIAVGNRVKDNSQQPANGLIIEQEGSTDDRQADFIRKRTIPGAIAALKLELGEHEALKEALWTAVCSPVLTIPELSNLAILCSLLYDAKTSLKVVLKYPRYWRVQHVGQGKIKFSRTEKVRTRMLTRPSPALQHPVGLAEPVLSINSDASSKGTALATPEAIATITPSPRHAATNVRNTINHSPPPLSRSSSIIKLKTKTSVQPRQQQHQTSFTPGPVYVNGATSAASPGEGCQVSGIVDGRTPAMSPPPRPPSATSGPKRRRSSTPHAAEEHPTKRPPLKLRFSIGAGSPPASAPPSKLPEEPQA